MFERVTKKDFINTIAQKASAMVFNRWVFHDRNEEMTVEDVYALCDNCKERFNAKDDWGVQARIVTDVRSNHIRFSNGSYLYFDGYGKRKYYRCEKFLLVHDVYDDNDSELFIVYYLID